MFKSIVFVLLGTLFLISCGVEGGENSRLVLKQKKNQVWSVKEENGEWKKDQITFLETYEYDEEGNEIGHLIYNAAGELAGKELAVFEDDGAVPVGTRYYTPSDSLLSYYTLEYDAAGRKAARKAYDAANDELLRIERYVHDDSGNLVRREIRNAEDQLLSAYEFSYDAHGNETYMTRKNTVGEVLFSEEYRIVKRDAEHRWLENWGWRDDKPVSFRSRELIYH